MLYLLPACRAARGKGAFGAAEDAGASGKDFLVDYCLGFCSATRAAL